MVKIVARQVAPIVAQSRIGFYFLQRLQQFFSALHRVTPFQQLVSQCFHNNDCERMRVAAVYQLLSKKMHKHVAACNTPHLATATPHKSLRDKLHEKLHRVTGPLACSILIKGHQKMAFCRQGIPFFDVIFLPLFGIFAL